jgi:hypothetical protein
MEKSIGNLSDKVRIGTAKHQVIDSHKSGQRNGPSPEHGCTENRIDLRHRPGEDCAALGFKIYQMERSNCKLIRQTSRHGFRRV